MAGEDTWFNNQTNLRNLGIAIVSEFKNAGFQPNSSGSSNSRRIESLRERSETENIKATEDSTKATEEHTEKLEQDTKAAETHAIGLSRAGQTLGKFKSFLTGIIFSRGLSQAISEIESSMKTGAKAGEHFDRQFSSFKLGVGVESLNELNMQSRLAAISMGGFSNWSEKVQQQQSVMYRRLGDINAAVQMTTDQMNFLSTSGISASEAVGTNFSKTLHKNQDILLALGVSYQESQKYLEDFRNSEAGAAALLGAASEKERKQIILNQQARLKEFKALGMTSEQAVRAADALKQVGGKTAIERLKEGAISGAVLSAAGVSNASEIAKIMQKHQSTRSVEESKKLQQAISEFNTKRAQSQQTGMLGLEGAFDIYASKLPQEFVGANSPLNSTLTENRAINQQQMERLTKNAGLIAEGNNLYEQGNIIAAEYGRLTVNALQNSALIQVGGGLLLASTTHLASLVSLIGGGLPKILGAIALNSAGGIFKGGKGLFKLLGKGTSSLSKIGGAGAIFPALAGFAVSDATKAITSGESYSSDIIRSITDKFAGKNAHVGFEDSFGKAVDFITGGIFKESMENVEAKTIEASKKIFEVQHKESTHQTEKLSEMSDYQRQANDLMKEKKMEDGSYQDKSLKLFETMAEGLKKFAHKNSETPIRSGGTIDTTTDYRD